MKNMKKNTMVIGGKEIGWSLGMAAKKLAKDLVKKENIPLNKAKEKALEIILDTKRWSIELMTDIFTYDIVKKDNISFDKAKEKAKKVISDGRKKGRKSEKSIVTGINNLARELSKKKNIPFDEAKAIIYRYIEKEILKECGLEETMKKLEDGSIK